MIGDTLRDAVRHIDDFTTEWDRFVEKFEKYGRSISTLQKDYDEIMGTRIRQMERKVEKVRSYSSPLIDKKAEHNLLESAE